MPKSLVTSQGMQYWASRRSSWRWSTLLRRGAVGIRRCIYLLQPIGSESGEIRLRSFVEREQRVSRLVTFGWQREAMKRAI